MSNAQYYKDLKGSSDLKTSACTTCKAPAPEIRAMLRQLPKEIVDKCVCIFLSLMFSGCSACSLGWHASKIPLRYPNTSLTSLQVLRLWHPSPFRHFRPEDP